MPLEEAALKCMVDRRITDHGSLLKTKGRILKQSLTSGLQQLGRMFRTTTLNFSYCKGQKWTKLIV